MGWYYGVEEYPGRALCGLLFGQNVGISKNIGRCGGKRKGGRILY